MGIQHRLAPQWVRFVLVGGVATGAQYVSLILFVESRLLPAVAASASAYAIGAAVNYLLNYYFTFASRQRHRDTLSKFVLVVALGLGLNTLSFWLLLLVLPWYLLAQVGATMITLVVNYLLHKHWIYRKV
ncbi:GtrA family protein [Marinimicrobium alkaliphilum]|uniref:GtrA family protein n=1 Tax=Marinimicrobium alkaliphilum TaxID=2202654 RepID=UPI000DB91C6F|nr:GtrA family protein [Marinimicrobium alkaliphilum]